MTEEFLHYLWEYRLLKPDLQTCDGVELTILHPGKHNRDGGPDFFNSRIRIRDTIWAGNVEIHVNASDWLRHRHQEDPAYENVILHVVFENDINIVDRYGKILPVLEVKGCFPETIYSRYRDFILNRSWIPCEPQLKDVPGFVFDQWSAALVLERLEQKIHLMKQSWASNQYDWEETCYQFLFKAFGFKINAHAFELLAKSISWRTLQKHRDHPFQLESLLFGQAGMLMGDFSEEYPQKLAKEYEFLRQKYELDSIEKGIWKFLRLRPSNFPTIRIAQLASLIEAKENLFSEILESGSVEKLTGIFSVAASKYWNDHFMFGRLTANSQKVVGIASIRLVIMNFVVPFMFFAGQEKGKKNYKERGMTILEQLPGEVNADLIRWKELGLPVSNALYTQALIQLKTSYCDKIRCLDCRIGNQLLRT
ncbi:MAG: DUF2851 family protein [Bacteroidetes bacterium]|nr:DUF2851 family protein [Bacteroidota bacterium]